MISLKYVQQYCKEYWKIENFQEAVNDTEQIWHCHHRHEIDWDLSREELIAIGRYYDVHYSELIFLTPEEHKRLHNAGENHPMYGKHHTEESKVKISDSLKGENNPMYGKEGAMKGKHHTDEWKQKTSDSLKGHVVQEETREKISNTLKGKMVGENNPNYKYHITEEELYNLYIVQKFSVRKIAELYGCCQWTIWYKLKEFNIKKI